MSYIVTITVSDGDALDSLIASLQSSGLAGRDLDTLTISITH